MASQWLSIFCDFSQTSQFLQKSLISQKSHVFSKISLLSSFSFLQFRYFWQNLQFSQLHACKCSLLAFKKVCWKKYNNSAAYFKVTSFLCSSFYFIFLFVLCLQICKFNDGKQYFCPLSISISSVLSFLFIISLLFYISPLFSGCLKYII